ncbi:MAG: hypothetical protein J0I19_02535 [Alphaproteobacteria bacterium]|nr:hypothetical protein [Alphaproteobacteria bacterium]
MNSKASGMFVRQRSDQIVCRNCGRSGTVVWDDVTRLNVSAPELAGSTGRFSSG